MTDDADTLLSLINSNMNVTDADIGGVSNSQCSSVV